MPELSEKSKKTHYFTTLILVTILIVVATVIVIIINTAAPTPATEKFSLSPEYYNNSAVNTDLAPDDLTDLIADKKSFIVYSSLPQCTADTAHFREIVENFQSEHDISFQYIPSDKIKSTPIYETVKYFPSVIIYKDGELIKYLDFNSAEDLPYYKSTEDFSKWLETYVNLEN